MDLTTERLLMRPFKAADITESYLSWLKDPVVTRFSNQRFRQHTMKSCTAYQRSFNESDNSFLLLIHREDAIPIGTLTIYRAHQHGTADIGLMLGNKAYWRKGLGLEAWTSALEAVLKEKGLRKVTDNAEIIIEFEKVSLFAIDPENTREIDAVDFFRMTLVQRRGA